MPDPTQPTPGDFRAGDFDPTDPGDLEAFRGELSARLNRPFAVPDPFAWPEGVSLDADGEAVAESWRTYPEDPAIRHHSRGGERVMIDVSFPGDSAWRVVVMRFPDAGGVVERTGRYSMCGPSALALVLAEVIRSVIGGDPPAAG